MTRKSLLIFGCLAVAWVDCLAASSTRGRTAYAADTQSLMEAPETGAAAFLREWVLREVSQVPITTYVQDVALPDLCLHDSKVGEVFGERFGEKAGELKAPPMRSLALSIRDLRRSGTDVMRVVAATLKPRGLEVLAGIRMADTHHRRIAFDEPLCPRFTIDHPEWVIRQPDGRNNETALDYSVPEVRAHRLAIMRELATGYEIDGLELNFIRWGKHFPRDQGSEKAGIMTAYIGEIRAMLDESARTRGRSRPVLGVRVPEGIRECWLAGLDPETWVRNGWIDYLVASTFNESSPWVAVDEFARFTKGRAQLLVSMGDMMGGVWSGAPKVTGRGYAQNRESYQGMLLTPAEARACAANYYAWGADGIAFWNVSTKMGLASKQFKPEELLAQRNRVWSWMNAAIDRENTSRAERHYHYLPLYKWPVIPAPPHRNYAWYGAGQSPLGTLSTQILRFPDEEIGRRQTYRFRMADGRGGEPIHATVRFRIFHGRENDRVEIDLNGRPVPAALVRRTPLNEAQVGLPGVGYELKIESGGYFRGDNELGIIRHNKASHAAVPYLEELEVIVR